jgi:hypothetical protein
MPLRIVIIVQTLSFPVGAAPVISFFNLLVPFKNINQKINF